LIKDTNVGEKPTGELNQIMPVLYHHSISTASRFIRLVLAEYGYQVDLVEEQTWDKRRDFLTLNPAGTLPVYVDDSMRALCGATVISEYLDETHGVLKRDRRLLAEDPFQRAEIRRLTEWFLQKMENDVTRPLARERVYKLQMTAEQGGGAPDSKVLRTARTNIRQHMKYLTWLAGSRQWLAGERMSYADLAAAASVSILDYLGEIEWAESPIAKEWYQRMKSRPSFRQLLTERVRGITPVSHYADLDF
jgi:glutathione S-transferase